VVSAVGTGTITIGGLTVELASATCRALGSGATSTCSSTFSVGQIASAFASTSPSLPATMLTAQVVLLRTRLPVQTAGATVEFEGSVSAFTAASGSTAATFTVRGVEVDTSGLPAGTSLPATGDIVQIVGTVSSDGNSVLASAIRIVRAARSASYEFEGDATAVVAGASASTYTLTLMGESITISAQTRLADRSSGGWFNHDPQANPFNISTFQTYLAASSSQHLIVQTATLSSISSLVGLGYNGGAWNGTTGIISSAAGAKHPLMALGTILNDNGQGTSTPLYGAGGTLGSTFGGSVPVDGDILVKYTYYGDANLDGKVDGSDYSLIDNALAANKAYLISNPTGTTLPYTGWFNGDFNYDGVIDGSDYTLIDNAFNSQGAVISATVAGETAQIAGQSTAVPEPTAGLLGMASLAFLRRRRRSGPLPSSN